MEDRVELRAMGMCHHRSELGVEASQNPSGLTLTMHMSLPPSTRAIYVKSLSVGGL
jgi:hypothetical protein